MTIECIEIHAVEMPLVRPFRTSQSLEVTRRSLLARVVTDEAEGWADLSVEETPDFAHETIASTWPALREYLVPTVLAGPATGVATGQRLARIAGHPAARGGLEMAVLDAELRAAGMSLSTYLGGTRTHLPVGVSVGITETVEELVDLVGEYVEEGYPRVKLKVQPGWDEVPLAAVRDAHPHLDLQVDGNGAYGPADVHRLGRWDRFAMTMIEQPFATADLRSHTRLAERLDTPICLDESIKSAVDAVRAVEVEACSIVNIKAARVGGYLEARRIHDVCQALGVPVWCGGMLESGVGRAANLALASLPGFAYPGDISATARYFTEDLTPPFHLVDGMLTVPQGPGIGVDVDPAALARFSTHHETFRP